MTKTDYLFQLENALIKNLDYNEVQSIISDYNEYFESGMQEGLSEQELCIKFGTPLVVAKEIFKLQDVNQNIQKRRFISHSMLFNVVVLFLFLQNIFAYNIGASIVIASLIPAIFLQWHEKNRYIVPLRLSLVKKLNVIIFLPFVFLGLYWLFFNGEIFWLWLFKISNVELSSIGPSASINLQLIYTLFLGFLLKQFLEAYTKGVSKKFLVTYILTGFMQSIWCIWDVLHKLSDPSSFLKLFVFSLLPICTGVILAIIFYMQHQKKRCA